MRAPFLASRKQGVRRYTAWQEIKRPAHDGHHSHFYYTQRPIQGTQKSSFLKTSLFFSKNTGQLYTLLGTESGVMEYMDHAIQQWKRRMQITKCGSRLYHANAGSSDVHYTNSRSTDRYVGSANSDLDDEPDIASALQGSLQDCQRTHAYMVEAGLMGDIYLVNLVLRAYSKVSTMSDAHAVFDVMAHPNIISRNTILRGYVNRNALDEAHLFFAGMPQRNVVSWNILITAYAHQGKSQEALYLFRRLYQENVLPTDVTFINALSACRQLVDLKTGRLIHILIRGCGLESSLKVGTTLINMYAKCSALNSAQTAFHKLHQHDVASWTSLISAYAQLGYGEVALHLYQQMQQEGVQPNNLTTQSILSAIANKSNIKEGKRIHVCVCFEDSRLDVDVVSALINMYGKCGSIRSAWFVFEDVGSKVTSIWNAMMAACIEQTYHRQALSLYSQRLQKGLKLDEVTFANMLSACARLMNLNIGLLIHSHLIEEGHMLNVVVNNALIAFYSRCKALEDAHAIFRKMESRSVVTWTCMIGAYGQGGLNRQALELFQQMQLRQARPNDATIATALVVCADSIALEEGRTLHAWIALEKKKLNSVIISGLINMYGKCGALADAFSVFEGLNHVNNIVLWNAMINGFAYGGHGEAAFECFFSMQGEGIEPDEFTFVSLLSAGSHAGMVDEATCCFCFVAGNVYARLQLEHCICIVDLLGRARQLAEAHSFVRKVPFLPDACLWSALEAVNRMHGDCVCERWASEHILEFDP